jgi:hypothetical protein
MNRVLFTKNHLRVEPNVAGLPNKLLLLAPKVLVPVVLGCPNALVVVPVPPNVLPPPPPKVEVPALLPPNAPKPAAGFTAPNALVPVGALLLAKAPT